MKIKIIREKKRIDNRFENEIFFLRNILKSQLWHVHKGKFRCVKFNSILQFGIGCKMLMVQRNFGETET